jgi:CRISPR-associated protein Csx10
VGGKRRRGAGRCRMTVDGFSDLKPIADWLENNREPVLNLKNERQSESPAPGDHVDGNWVKVTLKITALCPLIIPERTIGNLVKTLDYIPGTYLLPFISSKLKEVDIRSAIANGDVIVTNATPSVDGVAGRPTPLNLYYRKLDGGLSRGRGVLNRFSETDDGPQLKPHRGGYVGATAPAKLPTYLRTGLSVETHNVVEDNSQRPTSDVGGVFSYQSIDEGTECYAEIRLRESLARRLADHDSHWKSLLNDQRYRIGRARKDEYGAVKIELQNTDGQYRLQLENQEIPAEIRVWLLSDLLLRDERLRPTTSIARLAVELGARLGVSLELRRGQPDDCHQTGAGKIDFAVRTHRIDSWHTGWGLPRPSLIGLSAGSCFVFDIKKTDPSTSPEMFHQNLTDVAANGIGDRRAEGYGQICFDDPLLSGELGKIEINIVQESRPSADVRIPMTPYAHLIQIEAWRREIRRCAASLAMDPKSRRDALGMNAKPRMSQWGALRSVLTQVRKCQDSQIVENWFARVGKSENRSEEWPKETVDKVKKLVNDQSLVWNLLKNEDLGLGEVTLTFDGEVLVSKELWAEAVRTVVDACIRAHQRDREKSSKRIANQQTN